jgi:hypothetical protein
MDSGLGFILEMALAEELMENRRCCCFIGDAFETGLPDGACIFKPKNIQFGKFLEGLAIQDVSIFNEYMETSGPFDIFDGHLVYFIAIYYI